MSMTMRSIGSHAQMFVCFLQFSHLQLKTVTYILLNHNKKEHASRRPGKRLQFSIDSKPCILLKRHIIVRTDKDSKCTVCGVFFQKKYVCIKDLKTLDYLVVEGVP